MEPAEHEHKSSARSQEDLVRWAAKSHIRRTPQGANLLEKKDGHVVTSLRKFESTSQVETKTFIFNTGLDEDIE
jgi:hypothetical protein